MQPEQPSPSPNPQDSDLSPDYLDKISSPPKRKLTFLQSPKQIMLVAGLGLAVLISIILILVSNSGQKPLDQLASRFSTVDTVHAQGGSEIKNSQLRASNSTLGIYIANTKRDLNDQLADQNLNTDRLDEKLLAEEPLSDTLDKLEEDRLNGVYDRGYAREMSYLLDTLLTMIRQAREASGNQDLIDFLDSAHENLAPIQQEFAEFNETS